MRRNTSTNDASAVSLITSASEKSGVSASASVTWPGADGGDSGGDEADEAWLTDPVLYSETVRRRELQVEGQPAAFDTSSPFASEARQAAAAAGGGRGSKRPGTSG